LYKLFTKIINKLLKIHIKKYINYQKHLLKHLFGNICQSLKLSFCTHLLKLTTPYNNSLFFQLLMGPYVIGPSILKTFYKVTHTQYYVKQFKLRVLVKHKYCEKIIF
jgi:hypothetical protein